MNDKELIPMLYKIGAIKFGNYEIKRDFFSPLQIDLTGVVSLPQVAKALANAYFEKISHFSFDLLCGTKVLGACLANYLAWEKEKPLVLHLENGKKMAHKIEGIYKSGQKCLVLHDVLLSAHPLFDLIDDLKAEGIEVVDILSLVDWGMEAKKKLKIAGLVPHCLFTLKEVLQILYDAGKISGDAFKLSGDFLENVQEK